MFQLFWIAVLLVSNKNKEKQGKMNITYRDISSKMEVNNKEIVQSSFKIAINYSVFSRRHDFPELRQIVWKLVCGMRHVLIGRKMFFSSVDLLLPLMLLLQVLILVQPEKDGERERVKTPR